VHAKVSLLLRRWLSILILVLACSPPRALAQEREPSISLDAPYAGTMRWDPSWRRFDTPEYLATGALAAIGFGTLAIPATPKRWLAVGDIDAAVRETLRIDDPQSSRNARDASDILLTLSLNHLLADALVVSWWGHGNADVAWQMAMIDAQALAFNTAMNSLVAGLVSRKRPYRALCDEGDNMTELQDCRSAKLYRSFYSGHTSTTFTAAGLTCVHHMHLPLYGGGAADAIGCAAGMTAAAATGVLRIMSDQHYVSDVLAGAAMGTLSGMVLPWLIYYRGNKTPEQGAARTSSELVVMPTPVVIHFSGRF
jgi:membrane-associated phospholipid phosphatase